MGKCAELSGQPAGRITTKLIPHKKNGDTAIYPNDILKVRQGVALLHICNLTQVSIWDKYKERREVSKPFCRVIIDNRPGVAQMAIERTSAFDGNPDKVRNILQESLHALLAPAGLSIEIRAKMRVKIFGTRWKNRCARRTNG